MTARAALQMRWHRGTTAHLCSLYPFSVQASFGWRGAYVGLDLLAGGAEFCWDPFEAYQSGHVTNANGWILGEPGNGKSALIKTLLWRMAAIYGTGGAGGRWFAIADPKGEYLALAEALDLTVVRLAPGGTVRLNPLAAGPPTTDADQAVLSRAEMVTALAATVLGRDLTPLEDAALFTATEQLTRHPGDATLADLARYLAQPPAELVADLGRPDQELRDGLTALGFALDKLLTRSLRGMFDGPSTIHIDWNGPGLVLDLSAIPLDSDALPLVMVAAAGWLSQIVAAPGPHRIQIIDEAWALLANRHTAAYLQRCFKLGRTYGVANFCVAHRPTDLGAQADDGTAVAKIATGLLADAATKIVLRQAPDQLDGAATSLGLTAPERHIVAQLARGRALWKIGNRTAVVHHLLSPHEQQLCDTDARMNPTRPTAEAGG
jgi:type IV secretory pathway VirB4 component